MGAFMGRLHYRPFCDRHQRLCLRRGVIGGDPERLMAQQILPVLEADSGPGNRWMSLAPVASEFASSAIAILPAARLSPMMPEPTTVASRNTVPKAFATARRNKGIMPWGGRTQP